MLFVVSEIKNHNLMNGNCLLCIDFVGSVSCMLCLITLVALAVLLRISFWICSQVSFLPLSFSSTYKHIHMMCRKCIYSYFLYILCFEVDILTVLLLVEYDFPSCASCCDEFQIRVFGQNVRNGWDIPWAWVSYKKTLMLQGYWV